MPRDRVPVPDEFRHLLELIERGKLFALEEWIKAGKPFRFPDVPDALPKLLDQAIRIGFHSIVEILLRTQQLQPVELADALERAGSRSRYDLVELLETYGARRPEVDFATACQQMDFTTAERHLRSGLDPNKDNAFADALVRVKARPLLGFYRRFRAEFPALDDQAALALSEAVKQRQIRWTALLAWAGADPFRPVPNDLSETFPVDPENYTTAAKEAIWHDNPELLKALQLKPNPSQALELLPSATHHQNLKLFQTLLETISREQINDTPRKSSTALEHLVSRWAHRDFYSNTRDGKGDTESLQCLELLLDAGARWNPLPEEIRHARRNLLQHEPRYIVQVIRLLLYTPHAANIESLLELCRSQAIEAKIAAGDAPLVQEIKELRKRKPLATSSSMDKAAESAPAFAEQS